MDRYAPTAGNNTHQAVLALLSSYLLVWSTDKKHYSLSYSLIMSWLSTTITARWPSAAMCHIIIDIEDTDKHDLDIDQYYMTYIGSKSQVWHAQLSDSLQDDVCWPTND